MVPLEHLIVDADKEHAKKCIQKKQMQCVRQQQELIDEQNQYVIHV